MAQEYRFNRMELAGSLGDLGTLLPIAVAMVLVNGMDPMGIFVSIGLYYLLSGAYFGLTVPVQPMKVIGAYAVSTAIPPEQILASCLLMGAILLVVGTTGAVDLIRKYTPQAVIRGVQLSTGALLISGGIRFILGTSGFQAMEQAAEPFLVVQSLGPIPIGWIIGIAGGLVTLLLLDHKRYPAGLVVVAAGLVIGLVIGRGTEMAGGLGLHLPTLFGGPLPGKVDFTFALFALVLPQLPMTLGNAVLAYADLSKTYFGGDAARVTHRRACISMGLANLVSFCLGGMPLCHGAGGLAAHYRFGARTAGSNIMIGSLFLALALVLGPNVVSALTLLPMAVLGILLVFAGAQLCLTLMDLNTRKEFFVASLILGITLAANLAAGFMAGMVVAWILKWEKMSI